MATNSDRDSMMRSPDSSPGYSTGQTNCLSSFCYMGLDYLLAYCQPHGDLAQLYLTVSELRLIANQLFSVPDTYEPGIPMNLWSPPSSAGQKTPMLQLS
jgi:hypothetical protein